MSERYETHAKGIRIYPGYWRPHYPWEHIAWVSPSWPSQDYVWLDFPEAIFTDRGLIFLSHINPRIAAVYPDWPPVPWRVETDGISFERALPDGVRFGGSVRKAADTLVALELTLANGSSAPLRNIAMQTCMFLRACREFAEHTMENKFVHVPQQGWVPFTQAQESGGNGKYRLGWRNREGAAPCDWPVMAAISSQAERAALMTWHENTLSLIGNPNHPCLHADPFFNDLEPGASQTIHGHVIFHEGPLSAFDPSILGDKAANFS